MRRILVFLKYPEAGQVKTRLAETVGAQAAARLARHFAEATVASADGLGLPVDIHFDPPQRLAELQAWLGPQRQYIAQQGADLGARMRHAFATTFRQGAERAVLVGTDAPDRPAGMLTEALDLLDRCDAVLGPAIDGGYHLMALSRGGFTPAAFQGISWSTPQVLAQTLDALCRAGRRVRALPPWRDIDDAAGLAEYLETHPEAATLLGEDHAR